MKSISAAMILALTGFGCSDHQDQEEAPAPPPKASGQNFAFRIFWEVVQPIADAQNEAARRRTDEALRVIEDGLKRYYEKHGEYPSEPEAEPTQRPAP